MAMHTRPQWIGIDVSKATLSVAVYGAAHAQTLANEPGAIRAWLRRLPANATLAVEATNTYHFTVLELAERRGLRCYVLDGYRLNRYRESLGIRAKTDPGDAALIARFLAHEHRDLRPWQRPPKGYRSLQRLLHRRATLVRAQVALRQSLAELPELQPQITALFEQLQHLDRALSRRLRQCARESGWGADLARCEAIEGIGPLTACALVNAFHRGTFQRSDAFIAFLGLDVRVRDSGTQRGKRRLTKHGDSELRRLLHNAAMAARRSPVWAPVYERYRQRGLASTQVLVILARKLARIAFALMKNQSQYHSPLTAGSCTAT